MKAQITNLCEQLIKNYGLDKTSTSINTAFILVSVLSSAVFIAAAGSHFHKIG